jgi:HlyD family secretion protein
MPRAILLPLISLAMVALTVQHITARQQPIPKTEPAIEPPRSGFEQTVAATGIVEPRTENISIGSHLSGVVARVFVRVGDKVAPGMPLFEIDTRQIDSEIRIRESKLRSAQEQLARLIAMPRPEDVPLMEAQRREAEATVAQNTDTHARTVRLQGSGATTEEQVVQAKLKLDASRAQLDRFRADELRLKAGSWKADTSVSRAAVEMAQTDLDWAKNERSRHRVVAPKVTALSGDSIEFDVLQVSIRPGEYVSTPSSQTLMILGDSAQRHVRVDIDEHDIPRYSQRARAYGRVRGDGGARSPLTFVRIEPFVIPKKSLTGDATERVDTRVLQALYRIDGTSSAPFIGQQMDVFIEVTAR